MFPAINIGKLNYDVYFYVRKALIGVIAIH